MALSIKKIAVDIVSARGHPNIMALHKSTIEITKENFLTKRGDCIIAVSANKSASELSDEFKEIAMCDNSLVIIVLIVNKLVDVIIAKGSRKLTFKDKISFVIRKSSYIDDRTIALKANKAACDINRDVISMLKMSSPLLALLIAIKI